MSFSQFFSVLLARRMSALLLIGLLVGVVALISYSLPKTYVATAAVLIDVKSSDPVAVAGGTGLNNNSGYMATQIDLIQTERVAGKAMRSLGLDTDPAWHDLWQEATKGRGEYLPWVAEQLGKKLEIKPARDSNILTIGYLSRDPVFAAAAANAFVRAYIDTTLEMKVEPAKQYNSFFDDRARQLRGSLEQAQAKLSAYQQARGIVATDERLDVENARLAELSSQVVLLQGIAAESASRRAQSNVDSQEVLANVTVGNLTSEIAREEGRLSELRERLGERNPQVMELRARIDQLRARVRSESQRVSSSVAQNSNVDRARLGVAQAALNEQRTKVLRLRGQRDEASVLLRDIDSAQRAYDAALTRVSQTSLESQNAFTNVSIVKTASPPPVPTAPRPLLNVAVALVVGCLLAVGFTYLRETVDRRLRFDSDVIDALRQPMLARIPRVDTNRQIRSERLGLSHDTALSRAPELAP